MASFSELQTSVRRWTQELPANIDSEIGALVNSAMDDAQRRNNFNSMRWSRDYTLAEDQSAIARPERIKQLRGKPIYRTSSTHSAEMRVIDYDDFHTSEIGVYETGTPYWLVINDADGQADWFVHPASDGNSSFDDGSYRVRIFYYRYFAPLSGANDSNWLTDNLDQYIVAEAAARALLRNEEEERAAIARQEANTRLDVVVREDRRAIASGKDTLRPIGGVFSHHMGGYGYDYANAARFGRWGT